MNEESKSEQQSLTSGLDQMTMQDQMDLPGQTMVDNALDKNAFWQEQQQIQTNQEAINEIELGIWLHTEYQAQLEEAQALMEKEADETKPFEHKYEARKILQELGSNKYLSAKDSQVVDCAKAILKYKLGINYFECEEYHDSEVFLNESLELFNNVTDYLKIRFFNTIQDIYNTMGIIYCNRGNHQKGIPFLLKAEQIYNLVMDSQDEIPNTSILNDMDQYLLNQIDEEKNKKSSGMPSTSTFGFFISGGLDKAKLEKNYTLTLFYMAQVYTKIGQNEKAVHFCGETMKRQLKFKEYEIKDWAINCVNLAEYFIKNGYFSQAEYCLFAGISILPSDLSKKKKLRATLQMQLARYYLERLVFGVNNYLQNKEMVPEIVHKQFVEFPELNLKYSEIKDINDIEQAKLLFRLANTQFKKAMDFFVLDGFVTEHVQLKQDLSKLYKYLAMVEPDRDRVLAMQERRRELLETLIKELNPKAFEATVQELGAELSDIFQTMFDIKYEQIKDQTSKPKKADIEYMNSAGLKSIDYSKQIIDLVLSREDKYDYAQAVLNLELSMARIYSKLYDKSKQAQFNYLSQSYKEYENIEKFMNQYKKEKQIQSDSELPKGMLEQYKMCLEMKDLLPVKLAKLKASMSQ